MNDRAGENGMDEKLTAQSILSSIGGTENVIEVTHCFTRLRFILRDESKAKKESVEQIEGVISVVRSSGQFQVILGAKVDRVYEQLMHLMSPQSSYSQVHANESLLHMEAKNHRNQAEHQNQTEHKNQTEQRNQTEHKNQTEQRNQAEHKNQAEHRNILAVISQIFTPLVPAIAASGLIKGMLTAARLICNKYDIDLTVNDTYTVFYAASQVIFYFFPILLAMTCAKAFHCNTVIAMVIGGTLVYPAIDAMVQDVSVKTTIFGLPVIKGAWKIGESEKVFSYTESVIPILLAIIVMAYIERFLKRIIPEVVQIVLIPGIELIIMIPLTLCALGPVGIYIGNAIQWVYDVVINFSPILGGTLIGGLWGVFVIFGAHRALVPIGLNDVALTGRQNILAFAGAANFAQGGAALGVMFKTKREELKQIAVSGSIAATLVGVTEPAIYGCNLRLKKPMICAVIAGAIGGAVMGFGGVYGDAFANNGVLTIFTYASFGMTKFIFYLVGIAIAFFGAMILTYLVGFEELKDSEQVQSINTNQVIHSPITGRVFPLEEVKDEAFANGSLGYGVGILPSIGEVRAPEDGTVTVLYPTGHALGFTTDQGAELMIHVGIDTVKLDGKHFTKMVEQGVHVTQGTLLIRFELDELIKEGYDITTPVILPGSAKESLQVVQGSVTYDSVLVKALPKEDRV